MTPPRYAESLLRAFLVDDSDFHTGILGDMSEGWSAHVATHGESTANRWYWTQAIRSIPHLFSLWCETVGVRRVIGAAMLAIIARILVLLVQYTMIALAGLVRSGRPSLVEALAVAGVCVGLATLGGYLIRSIRKRDTGATLGVLCIAFLTVHLDIGALIHATMPTWMYWASTSPLSAIAAVIGGALRDTHTE